jgi:arylsulfatase
VSERITDTLGTAQIGRLVGESTEYWPPRVAAPARSPHVVQILLDDVGFAQLGCFGSSIRTPNIDRLASEGLRYTNFHTTALCSPTRAALLTGRNCHSVGFGHVADRINGFPGYSMSLPDSAATIAQILQDAGYSTSALGKWHLTPAHETGPQGPFDRWPIGRGFQRFYGFLGGCTDQYAPEMVRDNTPIDPPRTPGYHLSADLVDESIKQIRNHVSLAPHKPFYIHLGFGAGHAPHQVPSEWIDAYRGEFDDGWDVERQRVLQRQIDMGVMPPGTSLGESNPGVREWASLAVDDRHLFARMMEVYAGFLTHMDAQVGRLLDCLDDVGISDNTIVMLCSDNGASAEGGPEGSVDEDLGRTYGTPQLGADVRAHIEELGGPTLFNHYPWGWAQAGNTPFRWYKQFTHAGGITNGLIVRWPSGGVPAGEIRRQYHHVIDVTPTLLDAIGLEPPAEVRGVAQQPMHGVSMTYTFASPEASGRRRTQHYEMWGNRGLWHDGWMAVCRLQPDGPGGSPPAPMTTPFDELTWELYNHDQDPSERVDLALTEPVRLRAMVELWWAAAGQFQVLPLDDRRRSERWPSHVPLPAGADPATTVFHGFSGPHEPGAAPRIAGRSFLIEADVTCGPERDGVLYAQGGLHGGYCWYLRGGRSHFEVAISSIHTTTVTADSPITAGRHRLAIVVTCDASLRGTVEFSCDGERLGRSEVDHLVKRVPVLSGRAYVGYSPAPTVSQAFVPPNVFTGTIHTLKVVTGVANMERSEFADYMREQ